MFWMLLILLYQITKTALETVWVFYSAIAETTRIELRSAMYKKLLKLSKQVNYNGNLKGFCLGVKIINERSTCAVNEYLGVCY